jgi:hypothetical protein
MRVRQDKVDSAFAFAFGGKPLTRRGKIAHLIRYRRWPRVYTHTFTRVEERRFFEGAEELDPPRAVGFCNLWRGHTGPCESDPRMVTADPCMKPLEPPADALR